MASRDATESQIKHVAVFPPQTAVGCFLEIWPDTKVAHRDLAKANAHAAPSVHCREEEDPERWDGMS